MKSVLRKLTAYIVLATLLIGMFSTTALAAETPDKSRIDAIVANMTMDEKISQMIIPAIRTWNGTAVTDLDAAGELKTILRKHQYGGIILFGANITGNEQIAHLVRSLQQNNAVIDGVSTHIPYLMPVDEEGGIVIRLSAGTRMNGNMALGATKNAVSNAKKTGEIIGEELAAAGFNTDFAPVSDVNNNPANPVIGTRSFSDDPSLVAKLASAYAKGLSKSRIIATFKHFPGHGDTGTDSHIGTPSVAKTFEEIASCELIPFKKAIENGADLIMTAHITYPLIDEEVTFGDGMTKGFYPATMSKVMISDILRSRLGYNGVVVTDALEMEAIRSGGLVQGEKDSVRYHVGIAEKVIGAGVDILLLPLDLTDKKAASFYDNYIAGIASLVESGSISVSRIDESVKRILMLKAKYGIFDPDGNEKDTEDLSVKMQQAGAVIGSQAHHDTEMAIAREAITLLKNDREFLPLAKEQTRIVALCRQESDAKTIGYAIGRMKETGSLDPDAEVSVFYNCDSSDAKKPHYTDEMKRAIREADVVIGFSYATGKSALNLQDAQSVALHSAIADTHEGGGRFILVSENLPYDAAAYQAADAIVLAYLGAGLNIDPTERSGSAGASAFNANIIAAVETVFGQNKPKGHLPVNLPRVEAGEDGMLRYTGDVLYPRGYGLNY